MVEIEDPILSVVFSPDEKVLASGSEQGKILIWDLENASLISELIGHNESVNSVVYSADGKTLISGSADKKIKIWK